MFMQSFAEHFLYITHYRLMATKGKTLAMNCIIIANVCIFCECRTILMNGFVQNINRRSFTN